MRILLICLCFLAPFLSRAQQQAGPEAEQFFSMAMAMALALAIKDISLLKKFSETPFANGCLAFYHPILALGLPII